jgi:hypothetical protein
VLVHSGSFSFPAKPSCFQGSHPIQYYMHVRGGTVAPKKHVSEDRRGGRSSFFVFLKKNRPVVVTSHFSAVPYGKPIEVPWRPYRMAQYTTDESSLTSLSQVAQCKEADLFYLCARRLVWSGRHGKVNISNRCVGSCHRSIQIQNFVDYRTSDR